METALSKTQIDRLGDRLRKGNITDTDLRLLDEYRRSFATAYDFVAGAIRGQLGLDPTGRPEKSTTSIAEKLRRESIRLTQIQDIAGCRLVVPEIADQERVVTSLIELFPRSTVIDRRQKPSHGYRAVHVVATIGIQTVEIQVRTALQQLWAELSEKLSDLFEPAIKYGGGGEAIRSFLINSSIKIAEQENRESKLLGVQQELGTMVLEAALTEDARASIMALEEKAVSVRASLATSRENALKVLRDAIDKFQE